MGRVMKRWVLLALASVPAIMLFVVAFRSHRGDVQAVELAQLIDLADTLVVLESPREGAAVLFKSSDRRDLIALESSLRVERPEEHLHCMCDGTPAIFLYANGHNIGQITNHHAKLIRCSIWKSDARLVDVEAFLKWFDDRKIPGPRKEYEEALQRDKEWKANEQKWIEAMPVALRSHWPAAKRSFGPDLTPLKEALAEQVPEKNERILALFAWYGSGEGPWSGYPAYESIAERMLLDYSTAELLAAIEGQELTISQTEGAARLLAGWPFSQLRPADTGLLSRELKARLLKHSLASADNTKHGLAQRAFGGE